LIAGSGRLLLSGRLVRRHDSLAQKNTVCIETGCRGLEGGNAGVEFV
jgi:hypothetical protein